MRDVSRVAFALCDLITSWRHRRGPAALTSILH